MKNYVNIVIAFSDCFTSRGLQEILNELPLLQVAPPVNNYDTLCAVCAAHPPDVILLESSLISPYELQTLAGKTGAAIILHEPVLHSVHYQYYINKSVQGIVCRQQPVHILIEAIEHTHAGDYYYCSQAENFFSNYPLKGRAGKPLFKPGELEILLHCANGKTIPEIACLLFRSRHAIEATRKKMLAKTGTKNIAALVYLAVTNRLLVLASALLLSAFCD